MQQQLHTILQDFTLNGITDAVADTSFDWSTPIAPLRPMPAASQPTHQLAPQPAQHSVAQIMQPKEIRQEKPAPEKEPEKEVNITPADYIRTHGEAGAPLTILTANLPQQTEALPFSEAEKTLLTNILHALNIDINNINLATVTATTEDSTPLTPAHIQQLHQTATNQLKTLAPQNILVLGQLASSVFIVGGHTPLTALRSKQPQPTKFEKTPTVTTYHPRHLLKTPLLKQRTWQDIQPLLNTQ